MDGSDPLVASPLATWSIQLLDSTSRTSELTRSLDLCHLSSSDGRLRSSRGFATRDLEHPTFGLYPANLRAHEIPGSLPPVLLGWTAQILSWLRHSRLGASNFWTLPREPPSSRDPWISATCPPRMDGSDPLVASPLATWSIQLLDFYPANLRAHEIPGSLPPVLLGWTAQILSWLRHSRLGASNFWTSTPRTSEPPWIEPSSSRTAHSRGLTLVYLPIDLTTVGFPS
jgi:hypothetical protein